jgi:hypothetical protein
VFLGSRQHLLRQGFADRHQPLYRLARPMTLGSIDEASFARYIGERFAAGRSQITTHSHRNRPALLRIATDRTLAATHASWQHRPGVSAMRPRVTVEVHCWRASAMVWHAASPNASGASRLTLGLVRARASQARQETRLHRLSSKRQVTLPLAIVQQLRVGPG